ncbi:hypothetical protein J2S59_003935 [Nocardioides massiliensis]|uniref:Serine protease n=2 Tax=Nocardioides massiliensis TaxID=1325935 RepID=A0ABT9NUL3_9ACTN|nr:hypothetical protein [Nocardioides massiliensis]MDP9824126.1 hypothetical protein [Nocardioides massiliensis]
MIVRPSRRSRRGVRTTLAALAATALAGAAVLASAGSATAAPQWAPAGDATIHPGVQMYTGGGQCTGNFVFSDAADNVYVGYAAHCAGTGAATDTDGCQAGSLPLGTRVEFVKGGNLLFPGTVLGEGTLAYSSWLAMDEAGTTDANTCAYNDFALVKVDADDLGKVNPSIPFFGGPTGINTTGTRPTDRVYSYGNSSLRAGITLLSPKIGLSLGTSGGGWTHSVYTLTPGVPGDSGSAFVDGQGRALGTLSTLALAPLPASNGVGDLSRELAFAKQHSGIAGLSLVDGTEPFKPLLP